MYPRARRGGRRASSGGHAGFGAQAVLNSADSAPALLLTAAAALRAAPGAEGDGWAREVLLRRVKALHLVMHAGGRARADAVLALLGAAAERGGAVARDVLERVDWGKMLPRGLLRPSQAVPTVRSRRRDTGLVATRALLADLVLALAGAGGAGAGAGARASGGREWGRELLPDLEREVLLVGAVLQGVAHDAAPRAVRVLRLALRILRRPRLRGAAARTLLRSLFAPPVLSQLCAVAARGSEEEGGEAASLAYEALSGLLSDPGWGMLEPEAVGPGGGEGAGVGCVLPSRRVMRGRAVGLLLRLQVARHPAHFRLLVETVRRRPALGLALAQVWPLDPHPSPTAHWTVSTMVLIATVEATHARGVLRAAVPEALAAFPEGRGLAALDALGARTAVEPLLRRLFPPSHQKRSLSRGLRHANLFVRFRTLCLLDSLLEACRQVSLALQELANSSAGFASNGQGNVERAWQVCVLNMLPDLGELFAAHAALEAEDAGELDADTLDTLEADAAFEKRVRGEPAPEGGLKAAYVLRMLERQVRDAAGQYLRTFPQALDRSPLDPFKFFFGLQTVLPGSGASFGSKYASFRALMESQVFDESAACGMCSDQAKLQRLLRMQLAAGAKADGVHLAEASYRNLATLLRSTGMFCGNEAEVKALLDTLIVTHNHFPEECNGTVVPFVAHAVAHVLVKAAKVQNDLDAALAGCAEAVRDEAKKGPWAWSPLVPVLLQQAQLLLASPKRSAPAKAAVSHLVSMLVLSVLPQQGDAVLANLLSALLNEDGACALPVLRAAVARCAAGGQLLSADDGKGRVRFFPRDFVEDSPSWGDLAARLNDGSLLGLGLLCLNHCGAARGAASRGTAAAVAKSLRKALSELLESPELVRDLVSGSSVVLQVVTAVDRCLPELAAAGPRALQECLKIHHSVRDRISRACASHPLRAAGLGGSYPLGASLMACCGQTLDALRARPEESASGAAVVDHLDIARSVARVLPFCSCQELWNVFDELAGGLSEGLDVRSDAAEPRAKRQRGAHRTRALGTGGWASMGAGVSLLSCAACHLLAKGDASSLDEGEESAMAPLATGGDSLQKWEFLLTLLQAALGWGGTHPDECDMTPALLALPVALAASPFSSRLFVSNPSFFPVDLIPLMISVLEKKHARNVPPGAVVRLVEILANLSEAHQLGFQAELLQVKAARRWLKKKSTGADVLDWLAPALQACLFLEQGDVHYPRKCFALASAYLADAWQHAATPGKGRPLATLESMQRLHVHSLGVLASQGRFPPLDCRKQWDSLCTKKGWFRCAPVSAPSGPDSVTEFALRSALQQLSTLEQLLGASPAVAREPGAVEAFFRAACPTVGALASTVPAEASGSRVPPGIEPAVRALARCADLVVQSAGGSDEAVDGIKSLAAVLLKHFFHNGWGCSALQGLVGSLQDLRGAHAAEVRGLCADLVDFLLEHSQFVPALSEPGPGLPPAAARVPLPLETLLPVLQDDLWQLEPPASEGGGSLCSRKFSTVQLLLKLLESLCGGGSWRPDARLQTLLMLSYGGTSSSEDLNLLRCAELLGAAGGASPGAEGGSDAHEATAEVGTGAGAGSAVLSQNRYEFGDALRRARMPGADQSLQAAADRVLAAMDGRRVALAALSLPVLPAARSPGGGDAAALWVDRPAPGPAAVLRRHAFEHGYDPDLLFGFIAFHLNHGSVSVAALTRAGLLSLLLCGLSCDDADVRARCYGALQAVLDALPGEDFREKPQIGALLLAVRNAVTRREQRVPAPAAVFAAEAALVCLRPAGFLYPVVNKALLKRPFLQLNDLPVFYQVFASGTTTMGPEREWLFRLIAASLADGRDKVAFRRRMAVEAMMSRYQAAASGGERGFCTPEEARGIRAAVWRAVAVPRLARDLFLHGGLGAWLLWLLQTPEGRRDPDSEAFAMRLFEMLLQHEGIRQRATEGDRFPEYRLAVAAVAGRAAAGPGGPGLGRALAFVARVGRACAIEGNPSFCQGAVAPARLAGLLQRALRWPGAGDGQLLADAADAGMALLPAGPPEDDSGGAGGTDAHWRAVRAVIACALRAFGSGASPGGPPPPAAAAGVAQRFVAWSAPGAAPARPPPPPGAAAALRAAAAEASAHLERPGRLGPPPGAPARPRGGCPHDS